MTEVELDGVGMMESEKKVIERKTAEIFLNFHNSLYGINPKIVDPGESPELTCIDLQTGKTLWLEICLIENLPGEIVFEPGPGNKPIS